MKNSTLLFLIVFLFGAIHVNGQYVTPNTGQKYSLETLSNISSGAVIKENATSYLIKSNLQIAANDSLVIDVDSVVVKIDPGITVTVSGYMETNSLFSEFKSLNNLQPYNGFLFGNTSKTKLLNAKFSYGGGLKFKTGNVFIDNCEFSYNVSGINTDAAVEIYFDNLTGPYIIVYPTIKNSKFIKNLNSAFFGELKNFPGFLRFTNNYVYKNGKSNNAQIEILDKLSSLLNNPMPLDATKINDNQIIGDRNLTSVGGIHIDNSGYSALEVNGNVIKDNAYGVFVKLGPPSGKTNYYNNNVVEDNNTDSSTGEGFRFEGVASWTTNPNVLYNNKIRNNLIGIYSYYRAYLELGGGLNGSLGHNVFFNNIKNGEIIALQIGYKGLMPNAKYNCWREGELSNDSMAVGVIKSISNLLSTDVFLAGIIPYDCGLTALGTKDIEKANNAFSIYPNPNRGTFFIKADYEDTIGIFDTAGRLVLKSDIRKGENKIETKLSTGTYLIEFMKAKINKKISVK
ncbi:T9SS type A sorting domain-containing protein [Chryseobacterium rhizosphaerae]|uniref:T9SS type A sorting domain-containing protein n=1 Tax=Chryseobacterium rhizosphaerae TaxID=395937 RepID=UPI003D124416